MYEKPDLEEMKHALVGIRRAIDSLSYAAPENVSMIIREKFIPEVEALLDATGDGFILKIV